MANTKIIFCGSKKGNTENHELQIYCNIDNEIFIVINELNDDSKFITLDKSTAIKLHRELKKQISFIENEEGGSNGK